MSGKFWHQSLKAQHQANGQGERIDSSPCVISKQNLDLGRGVGMTLCQGDSVHPGFTTQAASSSTVATPLYSLYLLKCL